MSFVPQRLRFTALRASLRWVRWAIFALILWIFVIPIVPGFGDALKKLSEVKTEWLVLGIFLESAALFFYSMLTHVALGEDGSKVSVWTLFRIQLSTRSLGSLVPWGSAASSALGFRMITLAGA